MILPDIGRTRKVFSNSASQVFSARMKCLICYGPSGLLLYWIEGKKMGYFDAYKNYQLGKQFGMNPWSPSGYWTQAGIADRNQEKKRAEEKKAAEWPVLPSQRPAITPL